MNKNKREESPVKELPFAKKNEKSVYAEMTKEEKKALTLKRIQDDEMRAKQQLSSLKKNDTKKKPFVVKKKQYDLTSGYAICVCKIPDKEAYYFGLSTGTVLYFDSRTEKIMNAIKGENPILDILALPNDRLIIVDDYARVRIYDQYKLIKVMAENSNFVGGSYNYSKILVGNANFCFYINDKADRVIKVNLTDYSTSVLDLNRGKLFQLGLEDDKLYALSEEGYLIKANLMDMNKMNVDELEAYPLGYDLEEVEIQKLTNEQIGIGQKSHANDMLESSVILEGENVNLENSHGPGGNEMMEGGNAKGNLKSQENYERMTRVLNQPVKTMFFRTLSTSQDYIAVGAHDGQGHNIIYLYNTKLELKTFKYTRIDDHDFGFNLNKYFHKMHIEKRKEGTFLFAITHKKPYKMFIYKIINDEFTMFKRFKNIHSHLITDLCSDLDTIVTSSRDKFVNFYLLDYKFELRQ